MSKEDLKQNEEIQETKETLEENEEELDQTNSQEAPESNDEQNSSDQPSDEATEGESVEELEEKIEELEDQNLRLQAEIANMRRINQRDRQEAAKYASQSLATKLLDVIDNLERALDTQVESDDAKALSEGVEMVHSQLLAAFEKEDITVIDPVGEEFDPNYHQAVSTVPSSEEFPDNTVASVLQKGYQLSDRVIRPAMVIVSQ